MGSRYRHLHISSNPFAVLLLLLGLSAAALVPSSSHAQEAIVADNMIVLPGPSPESVCAFDPLDFDTHFHLRFNDVYRDAHRPEGLFMRQQMPGAQFEASYLDDCNGESWPQEAIDVFEHAMSIWSVHVDSDVPIRIEANWTSFSNDRTLASASPTRVVGYQEGDPRLDEFQELQADTWYPVAIASAITGEDIVGDQIDNEDFDIVVNMGCEMDDWHFGIAEDPLPGSIDFLTVVLHEIGHGLGFIGGMRGDEDTEQAEWGIPPADNDDPLPIIYDRFTEDGNGVSLLNEVIYPNPSGALYDALTGMEGGVFFDSPTIRDSDEITVAELFAPRPWNPGSSYAHLDQNRYTGTLNALMRPQIGRAERIETPGPIFCAMLLDMGWPLGGNCIELLDPHPLEITSLQATVLPDRMRAVRLEWDFRGLAREFIVEQRFDGLGWPDEFVPIDTLRGRGDFIDLEELEPGRYEFRVRQVGQREEDDISEACPVPSPPNQCITEPVEIFVEPDDPIFVKGPGPNPFRDQTSLSFVVDTAQDVRIDVYDVAGRRVATLFSERAEPQTTYLRNFQDYSLPSGLYFFHFIGETFTETRTATLVR